MGNLANHDALAGNGKTQIGVSYSLHPSFIVEYLKTKVAQWKLPVGQSHQK
jgi:hypothetical protein